MVTPVHRFHQVDCVTSQFSNSQQPRRTRQSHTSPPPYSNGEGCSEMVGTGRGQAEVDSSVYLEPPPSTTPPQLEAADIRDHPVVPVGKLRFGMWASFALAAVFVAGAKFYFDHQGTGLEVLVTCTVLVVLLYMLAGCTLSLCRSKSRGSSEGPPPTPVTRLEVIEVLPTPPPASHHHHQLQHQQQHQQILQQHQVEAPPPPYHIAIALPQCITPPPSYEKAMEQPSVAKLR